MENGGATIAAKKTRLQKPLHPMHACQTRRLKLDSRPVTKLAERRPDKIKLG